MAIAHESVKSRDYYLDEMWELSPHQCILLLGAVFAAAPFGYLVKIMRKSKRKLFKVTPEYVDKYGLDKEFIGKIFILFDDRISHIEKHRYDFSNSTILDSILNDLPTILSTPDFITLNSKNNSLQLIKKINDNVLIAIRISSNKELKIKTIYPINEEKYKRLGNNALK